MVCCKAVPGFPAEALKQLPCWQQARRRLVWQAGRVGSPVENHIVVVPQLVCALTRAMEVGC